VTAASNTISKTINIGCVGVGGRGSYLLQALLKIEGVAIRAVCDTKADNVAKAQKALKEAGKPAAQEFADWHKLLAMDGIDAVVSALPCGLHAQNYLDTIAAGKDLYGEKPICLTPQECDAVVNAAQSSDRIVQIGFQRRADPRFIETMQQIHAGELGELVEGRIAWSNAWGPLYDWFGHRDSSGDWMVEQACHNWDVINWASQGLPIRAMGMGRSGLYREKQPDRDVTDYYSAIVEYPNGLIVNILHSWVAPGQPGAMKPAFNDEYTRLMGTEAGIDFNTGTFSYRKELNKPDRIGHSYEGDIQNTLLGLQAFIESVRTRKPPVAGVAEGRDSVLACILVREAVYRRGVVTMEELTAK
jgi:myo-inositol 2-dehydrogenase / D-chiro-inositol 1-dehydrogenase